MAFYTLSGNDTLEINGHVFADLADGNIAELTFPSDIMALKVGKNGNALFALNETGKSADLKVRCMRGSADDIFLNGLLSSQQQDFAGFTLMQGHLVKKLGDGRSNITNDTLILAGGAFQKQVETKTNVEGDTEQDVAIYTLKFANVARALV
jgi:hypothetical protein